MREEFEKWDLHRFGNSISRDSDGDYINQETYEHWDTWQSAYSSRDGKFTAAIHSCLGSVEITDECLVMQAMNPDPTSMFVEHAGEIKEVSRNLVSVELRK